MSEYDSCSDEEEGHGILKKALDVELPEDFDPSKIPQTGEEYLQHVMYERMHCKTWLTADIDCSKFKNKQTVKINLDTNQKQAPKSLLPTLKWQEEKLEEFNNFYEFVRYKMTKEPEVSSFDEDRFLERILKETPVFSEMVTYSQAAKFRMLQIIAKYLDNLEPGRSFSKKTGAWIYSILSLIQKPLNPSFCYSLREFVKKLRTIRSNLPEDCGKHIITPLNLFICIAGRFFHQLDLADV